jgi:hypothetical protein
MFMRQLEQQRSRPMNFARHGELGHVAGQATYGMSNLRPKTTGLPFILFISQRDDARHAARVKWSPMPKVVSSLMGSYALDPFVHTAGPRLDAKDEALLQRWVMLNRDVLQRYRDGDISFTEDAVEQLKPIGA